MNRPLDNTFGLGLRNFLCLLLLFVGLTMLFTQPISTSPDRYLNDLADARLVAWTMAWNAHAVVTAPGAMFDANIYFPADGPLAWSETFWVPSALVAPLNWLGRPVLAYNVALLASFILSGLGAALWVRHMTGSTMAGAVAGLIWAFSPGRFNSIAHLHVLGAQWIPFALWWCGRYVESGRGRYLVGTLVAVGLQIGSSLHLGLYAVALVSLYAAVCVRVLPAGRDRAANRFAGFAAGLGAVLVALAMVAVRRGGSGDFAEMMTFSAQPQSFVAASAHAQAPHTRWLAQFNVPEASYFLGVLPTVLMTFALIVLVPRVLRRNTAGEGMGAGAVHWMASRIAVALFAFHAAGVAAAWWGASVQAEWLVARNQDGDPLLWAAVALTVAALTLRPAARRSEGYLVACAYFVLLGYALAFGPVVQAFGEELGRGPYWILVELLPPFQQIRAVGRIGVVWVLFGAALAGFAIARMQGYLRELPERRESARRHAAAIAVVVVMVVTIADFRVWPLPHAEADPAGDAVDVWLAAQDGNFALLHAPISSGPLAWEETRHMLGSTLHWQSLVNGYTRNVPRLYQELVAREQLGSAFMRRLDDFQIRYLVVHEDRLEGREEEEGFRRLFDTGSDYQFITQFGYSFVFARVGGGAESQAATARGDGEPFGFVAHPPPRFSVRGSRHADELPVVILAGAAGRRRAVGITSEWTGVVIEDSPDDGPSARLVTAHTLQPVGSTGAQVVAGFTLDVERRGATLGVGAEVLHAGPDAGATVHRLAEYGGRIVETRRFAVDAAGGAELEAYLTSVPAGEMLAVSMVLPQFGNLPESIAEALASMGVALDAEPVWLLAALGVRGAPAGSALVHRGHVNAAIDIVAPTPAFQVRRRSD